MTKMTVDDSADWDAKWLRPNVTRIPEKPVEMTQKRVLAPTPVSERVEAAEDAE